MSTSTPNRGLKKFEDADNVEQVLTTLHGENMDNLDTHVHTASDVSSGILDPARLGAGSPTAGTVLFGNGAWGAAPGGGASDAAHLTFTPTGGIAATDTQGAVAEVDAEKLAKSANLSDLADNSTAQANLGLGSAATHPSTFFLQAANNLSDLAARQTALDNLAGAVTSGLLLRGNGTHVALAALQAGDVPVLDASKISSGTMATARLGSGTADAFAVLFGDSSFKSARFQDFTPTWTATTTNPTLGSDGYKKGRYFQFGKLVVYTAVFRLGTVANGANRGSGIYHFGTPVTLAQPETGATSDLLGIATLARQYGGAITDLGGHALGHLHVPAAGSGGDGTFTLIVHDNVGASFESNLTRTTANVTIDQATHGSPSAWKDILTFPTLTARTPTMLVELDVDLQLKTDTATSTVVVSVREGSTELFRRVIQLKDADAFGANDVPLKFTHVLAPVDSTAPTLGDHTYKVSAFCPTTGATVTVIHDATNHISGYVRYTMRNVPGGSSPQYVGSDVPFLPTDEIGISEYWILGIGEAL